MKELMIGCLCLTLLVGCTTVQTGNAIRTGDALRIAFTGIPEPQTHTCTVDSAGTITLPLVGRVAAADKTPAELEVEIRKALSCPSGWIKSFDVSVSRVEQQ